MKEENIKRCAKCKRTKLPGHRPWQFLEKPLPANRFVENTYCPSCLLERRVELAKAGESHGGS